MATHKLPMDKKKRVIDELLKTEKTFVDTLGSLCTNVMEPLQESNLLDDSEFSTIFRNVREIYELHARFESKLKARYESEEYAKTGKIADIIFDFGSKPAVTQAYQIFIGGYPDGYECLTKKLKIQKFKKFIKNLERKQNREEMNAQLITPVQRVPRIVLLLKEIKRYSVFSDADYDFVIKALSTFQELGKAINQQGNSEIFKTVSRKENLFREFTADDQEFVQEILIPEPFLVEGRLGRIINGETSEFYVIMLQSHLIGAKRLQDQPNKLKFLWKIEILSSAIVYQKPKHECPYGKFTVFTINRIPVFPFVNHEIYHFCPLPLELEQGLDFVFWEDKFFRLFEVTSNISCLSRRAATTKDHIRKFSITETDLSNLFIGAGETLSLNYGEEIVKQDEVVTSMHYVNEGSLFVVKTLAGSVKNTIASVPQGNFIGEVSYLMRHAESNKSDPSKSKASASLQVSTPTANITRISHDKLEIYLLNHPEFGWRFYFYLCVEFSYKIVRLDAIQSSGGSLKSIKLEDEEDEKRRKDLSKSSPKVLSKSTKLKKQNSVVLRTKSFVTAEQYAFIELVMGDKIFDEYQCKFKLDFLKHGYLFISKKCICFHRTVFGKTTQKLIDTEKILSITPNQDKGELILVYTTEKHKPAKLLIKFKNDPQNFQSCFSCLSQLIPEKSASVILENLETETEPHLSELFTNEIHFKKGQYILQRGTLTNSIFQIISGNCQVMIGDIVARTLGANDIFGELSFLLGTVVSASIVVTSATVVVASCSWDMLSKVANENPSQAAQFYHFLAQKQCERFLDSEQRLAK